ncbi:MAG: AmmeMemoRadiSam system radical SAM enzyme [Candidatus Omnitrophica bacterium]|nr:AmmeMemoRadiSam system radical SAM enzyme [Candidatus Omnitrophota bacterium]MDD5592880.1 AmmeMemoRadiSam system radical SAM enzyme [Candidatus Omnitrophota bacterium]
MKSPNKLFAGLFFLSVLIIASLYLPSIVDIHSQDKLKEALFYEKLENKTVQCQLCPRRCTIPDGRRGFCGVRENQDGTLYTLVYAKPVAIHIDPIEKKPLFHFLPATGAFSIATAGCNLKCKFCQNWEISQRKPEELEYVYLEPQDLIRQVLESGSPTIAYTYSEPTIFYEYMLETAKIAREHGIKNIMHSCGYINEAPLRQLAKYLDAANIDLKAFNDDFYAKMSEAALGPVLESLKILRQEGVHVEITSLILSGYNDDEGSITKMCLWIKENLGSDTPLHFSRAFPMYKLLSLNPTPVETLEKARRIALDCGLKYVYIGNVAGHPAENTYCPRCKKTVIKRAGYIIAENNLKNGKCKFCGEKIAGVWQ